MRRRLVVVFVAVSTMVVLAFLIPLGFLVRRTAEDRAIDSARVDAGAVVPVLVAGGSRAQIESAVGLTTAGREGRMTVVTDEGWVIGPPVESARLAAALGTGASAIGPVVDGVADGGDVGGEVVDGGSGDESGDTAAEGGGIEVVNAVADGDGGLSAVRVLVPDATLHRGQNQAWAALVGVGLALVAISVLVADLLSRSIVRPTVRLAEAAHDLGRGRLDATVEPDGPTELVELAEAFNRLGDRVSSMLDRERELVAELSHRLRTPLTTLRMRADQVEDRELAARLLADIGQVTEVVNQLIDEARGDLRAEASCDVAAVVSERARFWSALAEDQQRPWGYEQGAGPIRVAIPAAELEAAVDVLLENVFAHTEEGVPLTVGYGRCPEDPDQVRIWVLDGGPGIDPASRARGVSGAGSTGLGLDIATRAAEAAGGRLEIGSSELGGASVALVLPIRDPEEP